MKEATPGSQSERIYERGLGVRLRRTAYGGAAFLIEHSATVELDEEAFAMLCWLSFPMTTRELRRRFIERFARNVTLSEIDRNVNQLKDLGFVSLGQGGMAYQSFSGLLEGGEQEKDSPREVQDSVISNATWTVPRESQNHFEWAFSSSQSEPELVPIAPESVHLQLNNVCNLRCPSCYVTLQNKDYGSLPLDRWITLVNEMADMGVFQLALGGGEPLMSPNFVPIVQQSRRRGLLPNVTTNGHLLTEQLVNQIRGLIGEVRLSFNDGATVNRRLLAEKSALLKAWNVQFGYNVIATHRNVGKIDEILQELLELHPHSITLLRPKPAPFNERWYAANALSQHDSMHLGEQLRRLEPLFVDTMLTVDCAFSYLFHGLSDEELIRRGVAGCAMGERFVVVAWNGDVYPCSHVRGQEYKMGNVKEKRFQAICETCYAFTHTLADRRWLEENCSSSTRRKFCGGCPAVASYASGNGLTLDAYRQFTG
jgi:radical SAM protein with 4Fe4S-binding SPASM domain